MLNNSARVDKLNKSNILDALKEKAGVIGDIRVFTKGFPREEEIVDYKINSIYKVQFS